MNDLYLAQLDVAATAAAVRAGELTAVEVTAAALARIAARNSQLNALEVVRVEAAMEEAARIDRLLPEARGPLAGVPIAVKAEADVARLVTTYGGRANSTPAAADSESVRRLRAAGAVIVGTTRMPEFGQFPFTEGAAWGQTLNPWSLAHTPGGSSGGSAAAVAAGLVPAATGGDGGGSIRIPASCCGLVGLKPMRGRVSAAPAATLWGALGTLGPLTRTVADTALLYDVLVGSLPTDRYVAPPLAGSLMAATQREPQRLRVAWLSRPPAPVVRVHPEVVRATAQTARTLAEAGHEVTELSRRLPDATWSFLVQFLAAIRECSQTVEHRAHLEARSRRTGSWGALVSRRRLRAAVDSGDRLRARLEADFADVDVLLTPTLACVPPRVGQLDAVGSLHAIVRSLPMTAFTTLANVTGQPAISIPAGRSREGLPIGVQLISVRHDETVLVSLAAQLERLNPWPLRAEVN